MPCILYYASTCAIWYTPYGRPVLDTTQYRQLQSKLMYIMCEQNDFTQLGRPTTCRKVGCLVCALNFIYTSTHIYYLHSSVPLVGKMTFIWPEQNLHFMEWSLSNSHPLDAQTIGDRFTGMSPQFCSWKKNTSMTLFVHLKIYFLHCNLLMSKDGNPACDIQRHLSCTDEDISKEHWQWELYRKSVKFYGNLTNSASKRCRTWIIPVH